MAKRILAVGKTTPRLVTKWNSTTDYTKYRQTITKTTDTGECCTERGYHLVGRLVPIDHVDVGVPNGY
jgi:hypothetical protein